MTTPLKSAPEWKVAETETASEPKSTFAMLDIVLSVTSERVDGLEIDLLIRAQDGDMSAMRDTLAHFLVDGSGKYMQPHDRVDKESGQTIPGARSIIGRMTIGQLKLESANLQGSLRDDAAPKVIEKASGSPSPTD